MSTFENNPRPVPLIDQLTAPTVGMRVFVVKVGGQDVAIPLTLNTRPAKVTDVVDATHYKVTDYYYGFDLDPVTTELAAEALDENAVFSVDQRVVIITAGSKTYIIGAAASTRILIHVTGAYSGGSGGHPFEEWDPVGAAAVSGGETGHAKEYNGSTDTVTGLIVWAEKHGSDWKFFYPIRNNCDG